MNLTLQHSQVFITIHYTTAVPQLFRTTQAENLQWVPSSWVRDNRREFRLRTNEYVSNLKFHALIELFWT